MSNEQLKAQIQSLHKKAVGSVYQTGYNDALVDVLKLLEGADLAEVKSWRVGDNHPLAHLFGKFNDDPCWPDFEQAIKDNPDVIEGPDE